MTLIKDVMTKEVNTIHQGATLHAAALMMNRLDCGLLVVVEHEASRRPVGVISDTDIIKKVVCPRKDPGAMWVKDYMTQRIISTTPDETITNAADMMKQYKVKRLIIIKDGLLEGILSMTDIVPHLINYKKKLLDIALDF